MGAAAIATERASSRFDDKNELVFVSRIDEDRLICPLKLNVLAEGRIGRMEKREEAREANHKTYQLHKPNPPMYM